MLIVAIVLAAFVAGRLGAAYHGNPTGFVRFGALWAQYTDPPPGALVDSAQGYDGQFFWVQAKDPLLLDDATVSNMRRGGAAFRLQRMAYPTLVFLFAAGQPSAILWSLLAINLLLLLGITAGFALYARRRGWSGWWALALGLMPGLVLATMRDLSDPLAVASMLAGLLMWQEGRRWWSAALLTVAVLAREPMMLAVLAIALDAGAGWWRARPEPGSLRRAMRRAWPAVVVPAVAFFAWQAYIDVRYGGNAAATSSGLQPPFKNLVDELKAAVDADSTFLGLWDLAYLTLMVAAIATAVAMARSRLGATSVVALLFGLSLLVVIFGDDSSYTRLSAPLFAALLIEGLRRRNRCALALCAAAAALTAFVPLAVNW